MSVGDGGNAHLGKHSRRALKKDAKVTRNLKTLIRTPIREKEKKTKKWSGVGGRRPAPEDKGVWTLARSSEKQSGDSTLVGWGGVSLIPCSKSRRVSWEERGPRGEKMSHAVAFSKERKPREKRSILTLAKNG